MIRFGTVDCTVEADLAKRYDIQGFPTIKVFPASQFGKQKDKNIQDYQGPRNAAGLTSFGINALPSNLITSLRNLGSNADEALQSWVSSSSSVSSPVRVLLFSTKPSIPPLLKALSVEFEGQVGFGLAKEGDELAHKFKVESYPSLFFFRINPTEPQKFGVQQYKGPMGFTALVNAIVEAGATRAGKERESPVSKGPIVSRPLSQTEFESSCVNKGGLCVIAVVDRDLADTDEGRYLLTYEAIADHYHGKSTPSPFNFILFNRIDQPDLVDSIQLPVGPISVCVLSPKKQRAAVFIGVFTEENVIQFLDGVKKGAKTFGLPKLPKIRTVESEKSEKSGESGESGKCSGKSDGQCTAPPTKKKDKEEL